MERIAYNQLINWKNKEDRKPLIINGARQVGKTYLINDFGKKEYKQLAYINCDHNDRLQGILEVNFDIPRIILSLSAYLDININSKDTLIVFDEIQECPLALNLLKYFYENAPEYHVIVAGSLLGISLHSGTSFPVGKVDMIKIYPMNFEEFLLALGKQNLIKPLKNLDWQTVNSISKEYIYYLKQYYYVGGMPGVVKQYVDGKGFQSVRQAQKQILFDYSRDFSKHTPNNEVPRLQLVWDSIPSQLAKENKKFIFNAIKKGARANDFEIAIQWLIDAGLIYKVDRVTTPDMPLKFYDEMSVYKLFILDVGLMGAMTDTSADTIINTDDILCEYKGAFTELYVLTQLKTLDIPIYYFGKNDSKIEIDFVIQCNTKIIPLEVKAMQNVKSKSLKTLIDSYPKLKGMRISMLGYKDQEWMENVPLYGFLNLIESYCKSSLE